MTETLEERLPGPASRSLTRAWGVAGAAAALGAFIGVGAVLSDASGDRPSGILILVLLALAGAAVIPARRQPRALAQRFAAIGIGQMLAAATMMVQGWGVTSIIAAVNGILVAGWLLAAVLFFVATRQSRSA